jgi:hypothetical protein
VITIVSGFGRCGSSLVMQMLEAGGMPMVGRFPAFEDDHTSVARVVIDPEWMGLQDGRAVKILDPHEIQIPAGDYRVIWCSREYAEQARSQVKFAAMMMGLHPTRESVRAFMRSYVRDKPKAIKKLIALAPKPGILDLHFEDILSDPLGAATELAQYCGLGDPQNMASVVKQRSPLCARGLDMEIELLAQRSA